MLHRRKTIIAQFLSNSADTTDSIFSIKIEQKNTVLKLFTIIDYE
jgi:hypothetical protein